MKTISVSFDVAIEGMERVGNRTEKLLPIGLDVNQTGADIMTVARWELDHSESFYFEIEAGNPDFSNDQIDAACDEIESQIIAEIERFLKLKTGDNMAKKNPFAIESGAQFFIFAFVDIAEWLQIKKNGGAE